MKKILHIITRSEDVLAEEVVASEQASDEIELAVVRLNADEPDYDALLAAIFENDSAQVW